MIRSSIRRPVTVTTAYAAVALLGVAAWRNVPVELLPDAALPRLEITAEWPGASPETVEAFVTAPIEGAVQRVRGVERITSESFEEYGRGRARIEVAFHRGVEMDFVRLELSERIASLEEELPPGARGIRVRPWLPPEYETRGRRSLLRYTITGPLTPDALRAHLRRVVAPALSRLEGVALVRVLGGRDRIVEVELDADRVRALGLSPVAVYEAVDALGLIREAGAVREGGRRRTVTIRSRPGGVEDVRNAAVTGGPGRLVRVSDVADVRDTREAPRSHYRIDGRPAVAFEVVREIGANTLRAAERVKAEMARLAESNPAGSRFLLDVDRSEEIRSRLADLRVRALVAGGVIFVVLFLFLGSFPSAAMIFTTIAFSVLVSLNLIHFGGMSLNLLTLLGLATGFGLVVDNSIVVLENVYRRWQGGEEAGAAAEEGAREVVLPILASTATTLVVFVPFVYLQGELRIYYVPLAVVVGLILLASLVVAFTLIPALSSRVLGAGAGREGSGPIHGAPGPISGGRARCGAGAEDRRPLYLRFPQGLLGSTLRHPWVAVVLAVAAFGGSCQLFDRHVARGVVWGGGWGEQSYLSVRITLPRGSDLERTDALARRFEERLAAMPEVQRFTSVVRGTFAQVRVEFPDSLESTVVPAAINERMVAFSLGFSGADVRVYGVGPSFHRGRSSPPGYGITVSGYDYGRVREIAENIGARLVGLARVRDVDTNASGSWYERDRASEVVVTVDRDALARHGMTVEELVGRLSAAVGGRVGTSTVKLGGEELRIDVKVAGHEEVDVRALRNILIRGADGRGGLRLGDVIRVEEREVQARIRRENQRYERRVTYEFRGPRKLGDAYHRSVVVSTDVPPGYAVEGRDPFQWSEGERRQVHLALAVSVLLVYLVTAALFESLRQPLCVLLTVPMALIGVFLIFLCSGASFTREAYVGVIVMGGIVVNDAILLVDRVNRLRRERPGPERPSPGDPSSPAAFPGGGGVSGDTAAGRSHARSGPGDGCPTRRFAAGDGLGRPVADEAEALRSAIVAGTLQRVRPILMTTATTVLALLPLILFDPSADANVRNGLTYALLGGLLSSTLLVLTVTPALYYLLERGPAGRRPARQAAGVP